MTDRGRALELISRFRDFHVLTVGDFYLDEYVYGSVAGISPEMPVLRFVEERREHRPGAAGNVAANLAALGAQVSALGVIGKDEQGRALDRKSVV